MSCRDSVTGRDELCMSLSVQLLAELRLSLCVICRRRGKNSVKVGYFELSYKNVKYKDEYFQINVSPM